MDIKRGKIDGRLYNVVSPEVYAANPNLYPTYSTAIEKDDYIIPIRNKTDEKTGTFFGGMVFELREEYPGSMENYRKDRIEDFYDLGNNSSTAEFIRKQDRIAQINKEIMENIDSVYVPCRNENDVPEMALFKDALEAKHMDIDKYIPAIEAATGSKFNNDKRLLNKSEMTIKKMKGFADGLDLKLTLIIEDKDPNVPNPMGKKLCAVINSGHGGYEEE